MKRLCASDFIDTPSQYRLFRRALLACSALSCLALPNVALAQSAVEKLQEFPLDQVQITDEYQKNLFNKEVTYLITTLDSDRLLAGFKAAAQNANPTNPYGGWENTNIRGHTMGHWLSALAHAYQQALGSDAALATQIKAKLDDVVSKLKSYQQSNGFLFATPISQFNDFDAGTGSTWVPYYTMHKILAGLIDVYAYTNSEDALKVASKLGDWLYARATGWSSAAKSRVLSQEYGGMNDALYELYKYTKSADHLAVAHIFDDTSLFSTMAAGTDNLNGKHANMTIPKFLGALNRYKTLGSSESAYLNAATGFFSTVLKSHTYVTGGNSEDEHFRAPGSLDANRNDVNNETCNAYNMSKLTRELFKVTADVKYADFYDRIHINEILSSINPETGMTTYFKPMGTGYFKAFGTTTNSFWCCTGTGMENFTKLGDSVYFHDSKDLWVTYYVNSTLNWKDRGVSLTQVADLPLSDKVTFTIVGAPLDAMSIRFRKPYWLASCGSMAVAVNNQSVDAVESGGFVAVNRVWQAGDKVELTIPSDVQVSRLPDNPNAVAFTYGPLVLSAGLGTASMTTTGHAWTVAATKPSGLQESIAIKSDTTINSWLANIKSNLVQTAGKLEFNLKNTDSDGKLVFIPQFSRYKDRYGIYWKLTGTAGPSVSPPACVGTGGTSGVGTGGAASTGGASSIAGAGGRTGTAGASSTSGTGGIGGTTSNPTGGASSSGVVIATGGRSVDTSKTDSGGASMVATRSSGGSVTAGGSQTIAHESAGGAQSSGGSGSTNAVHSATGGVASLQTSTTSGSPNTSTVTASGDTGQDSSGCSCRLGTSSKTPAAVVLLIGLGLLVRRRRRY